MQNVRIRVLRDGCVVARAVRKKGAVVATDTAEASELVRDGWAAHATRVRCLVDGALIGNRVAAAGEVLDLEEAHAVVMHNRGVAEVVEKGELSVAARESLETPAKLAPEKPRPPWWEGLPTARIRVTAPKGIFCCDRHHSPGVTVEVPEFLAARIVAEGLAVRVGVDRLIEKAGDGIGAMAAAAAGIVDLGAPRENRRHALGPT